MLPTIKLGPSGADSRVRGFVNVRGSCGSVQRTLLWGWEFLLPPQPPQVFSVRGFEALFPCTGTLDCVVCPAPQLFLPVYLYWNVELPCPQAAALPRVLYTRLPVSAPPMGLDECFFFNSLVVGLPYSLILCQFWLFFVFKFVVFLLLLVSAGTLYLPIPPSWPDVLIFFILIYWSLWFVVHSYILLLVFLVPILHSTVPCNVWHNKSF